MVDIAKTASTIEHDAYAAEHGDAKALSALHNQLHSLSPAELKQVAEKVQKDMGDSSAQYYSSVAINRDVQGNVMSLDFSPSLTDRASSLVHGGEAHALHVTVTPVDNINASPEMVQRATAAFQKLPPAVRELLLKNGYEIRTVDRMPDAAKHFWGAWLSQHIDSHPRGYPKGATWENNTGYQDGGTIYMAERFRNQSDGAIYKDNRVEGTVRHESGHRMDSLLGWTFGDFSDSSDFKAAYQKDIAKIPQADRAAIEYYLQKDGGRSETFAEVFALMNGGGTSTPEADALITKYFTNTRALIQKQLDDLANKH